MSDQSETPSLKGGLTWGTTYDPYRKGEAAVDKPQKSKRATDKELYGAGLLGESLAPLRKGELNRRFQVSPFTVMSAREGWWQDRKRAWLALGIQSELGRGGAGDINAAAPGGAAMPAMNYSNRERGDGAGRAIPRAAVTLKVGDDDPPTVDKPREAAPSQPAEPQRKVVGPKKPPKPQGFNMPSVTINATPQINKAPPAPERKLPFALPPVDQHKPTHDEQVAEAEKRFPTKAELDEIASHIPTSTDRVLYDEATWNDPPLARKTPVLVDVESFPNFFIVNFKRLDNGKRISFELSERHRMDIVALEQIMETGLLISFNGLTYDAPIIYYALKLIKEQLGRSTDMNVLADVRITLMTRKIKEISDRIIRGNMKHWEVGKEIGIAIPDRVDHIDLMEPNPSIHAGLKMLNGRLHGKSMRDLPYDDNRVLSRQEMCVVVDYCFNDIEATELLWNAMKEPIELRRSLSRIYNVDLRSKSDAQVGEAIVRKRVEASLGRRLKADPDGIVKAFRYKVPDFISFEDERLNRIVRLLGSTQFKVNGDGSVYAPDLEKLQVEIGDATYSMGIGGLHSTEKNRSVKADEENFLLDVDVASQYPSIIMKLGLYPKATGKAFLNVYGDLLKERLAAKEAGDKVRADGGKIALNGVYGKLGSPYSVLCAPDLMVHVTLTGQLSLLMMIERAEMIGASVVSANTDGIVIKCPRDQEENLMAAMAAWENAVGFKVEMKRYSAIYNESVNTYFAVGEDGKVKRKGDIANPWKDGDLRGQMSKNPQMTLCSNAVAELITKGTPIEDTVRACKDVRDIVTIIRVKGGGTWRGAYIGQVVRYYWAKGGEPIRYATANASGSYKKVAKTDGAKPMMVLPDVFPDDVDFDKYINEAYEIAYNVAALKRPSIIKGGK